MYIVYTELGTTWVRTCPWEGGCKYLCNLDQVGAKHVHTCKFRAKSEKHSLIQ